MRSGGLSSDSEDSNSRRLRQEKSHTQPQCLPRIVTGAHAGQPSGQGLFLGLVIGGVIGGHTPGNDFAKADRVAHFAFGEINEATHER